MVCISDGEEEEEDEELNGLEAEVDAMARAMEQNTRVRAESTEHALDPSSMVPEGALSGAL